MKQEKQVCLLSVCKLAPVYYYLTKVFGLMLLMLLI